MIVSSKSILWSPEQQLSLQFTNPIYEDVTDCNIFRRTVVELQFTNFDHLHGPETISYQRLCQIYTADQSIKHNIKSLDLRYPDVQKDDQALDIGAAMFEYLRMVLRSTSTCNMGKSECDSNHCKAGDMIRSLSMHPLYMAWKSLIIRFITESNNLEVVPGDNKYSPKSDSIPNCIWWITSADPRTHDELGPLWTACTAHEKILVMMRDKPDSVQKTLSEFERL